MTRFRWAVSIFVDFVGIGFVLGAAGLLIFFSGIVLPLPMLIVGGPSRPHRMLRKFFQAIYLAFATRKGVTDLPQRAQLAEMALFRLWAILFPDREWVSFEEAINPLAEEVKRLKVAIAPLSTTENEAVIAHALLERTGRLNQVIRIMDLRQMNYHVDMYDSIEHAYPKGVPQIKTDVALSDGQVVSWPR